MKNNKSLLLIVMLLTAGVASAQYAQEKPNVEFMFKVEAGYLHNVGNYGKPTTEATGPDIKGTGYNLNAWEEGAGLNLMAGVNISQDFFLGGGVGYSMCAPMRPARFDKSSNLAALFIDMDFMNPNNYGNTISPYLEVYAGLNWFYDHALMQMERNYHSLFVETGITLVQGTVFIPIRVGWRW